MGHLSAWPPVSSCSMYFAWALEGAGKGSRHCKGWGLDGNSCAIQGDLGCSCMFHTHLQHTRQQTQTTRCAQTRPLLSYRRPNLYISLHLSLYISLHSLAVTDPLSVCFSFVSVFSLSFLLFSIPTKGPLMCMVLVLWSSIWIATKQTIIILLVKQHWIDIRQSHWLGFFSKLAHISLPL